MNETQLLETLDRRVAAAVDALDEATRHVDPPLLDLDVDPGPPPTARGRRRWTSPVAVAASLVLLAALAVVLGRGDDDGTTVANPPDPTYLVLPGPEAQGFELVAAFDGTGTDGTASHYDLPAAVHGDASGSDPWASAVVDYELPADSTTLDGTTVDLGGVDGVVRDDDVGVSLGWRDGDVVRYLMSARVGEDELIAVARAIVAGEAPVGAAPSGREVLFEGQIADVFPVLSTSLAAPSGVAGVAYRQVDGEEGFVVGYSIGSEDGLRASSVLSDSVQDDLVVRGNEATLATFGDVLWRVAWLEDGTMVIVEGSTMPVGSVLSLVERLEAVSAEEFAQLVAEHGPREGDGGSESFEERGQEIPSGFGDVIAEVAGSDADASWSASVVDEAGEPHLEIAVSGGSSGSATSTGLPDLATDAALRHLEGDTLVVAGLIGPEVDGPIEIVDELTGQVVPGSGPSTAVLEGSDHLLVGAAVDGFWADRDLAIVGRRSAGREVRVPVPIP